MARKSLFTAALLVLVAMLSFTGLAGAANVRHIILNQQDWNGNVGLILEFNNDQSKDDAIAQMKTLSMAFGLGNEKAWHWANTTHKWEANKEYAVKAIVTPATMELQIDGKKKSSSKGNFVMFNGKPQINGVPEWSTGQAAYGVYIKSLKVTTSNGNDYEATYDKADYEARMAPQSPEWQLADDDTGFTVEFVFSIIPEE